MQIIRIKMHLSILALEEYMNFTLGFSFQFIVLFLSSKQNFPTSVNLYLKGKYEDMYASFENYAMQCVSYIFGSQIFVKRA